MGIVDWLFESSFMPHGHCFQWTPSVLWLHVLSDVLIALAYYSIPITLVYFVRHRRDLAFGWIFLMFGAFICACGTTHLIDAWNIWNAHYHFEGVIKFATAMISAATAITLIGLVPKALALPTSADLEAKNRQLSKQGDDLRLANEALERSNIELQRFAYIASHDLQTPLRSVTGFVQALQLKYGDALDDQAQDWINRTVRSARQMETLIRDLLAYSRVDSQVHPVEEIPLREVVDSATLLLDASIRGSNAQVTCGELPTVRGERSQLVQLVQNLIGNAIKYRGEDPPRVEISARRDGQEWVVSVRDNGIGIQPQHFDRIFEIFQRLHHQREYPGTGIGLAVCRRVVSRHGGRIWVDSEPGKGSTFRFTIRDSETTSQPRV